MKLLIVSDAWHPQLNGVVRTLENTIREVRALGHEVEITGPEKSLFNFPTPTYPEIRLEFFAHKRLKALVDRFQPDYIHLSTEGPLGVAMRELCLKYKWPFSTAYHTCFPEYFERRVPKLIRQPVKALMYQLIKLFHAPSGCVMTATPTIEALLRRHRITRLKRWSRGVDLSVFHPYGKDFAPFAHLPRPIFIYVGRVAVEKNLEAFLNADLPGSKVIIGDGPDAEKFKRAYPAIHFLGRRVGEDLARHYSAADVFVFPSTTDTFGLVLLEALASGIPVAAYPVQGPRDVLGGAEAAKFAALNDDLREAALKALELKPAPEACHDFVKTRYSWSFCTQQFITNLQATTPFNVRRLGRFSVALDFVQMIWRRIRTLPKFYPSIYRVLSMMAEPLLPAYLNKRMRKGKEDPARMQERFGYATVKRPTGRLIWCHAASVGESLSMLPLLEQLEAQPSKPAILLTTGTRSSAQVLAKRLPPSIIHQYVPVDTLRATERFMAHWHPDFALITESELWPNLIGKLRKYAIPAALINARMSKRSAQRWGNLAGLWIAAILRVFNLVLAQSTEDAARLEELGAYGAKSVGNLKAAARPLPYDEKEFENLKLSTANRPLWLMASTHEGEEDIALRAATELQKTFPSLLTIIAPRHPDRAEKIMALAKAHHLNATQRSKEDLPQPGVPLYLADTLGEMGLFYKLCPVVCVGGSFAPKGGHNPVEAAAFGCAIVFGPDMRNFGELAAAMVAEGAARQVANESELQAALKELLGSESARSLMGTRARAFYTRQSAVLTRVMAELQPLLDETLT